MNKLTSYRLILQEHFEARKQRNPAYSLRAYARDLGWSVSRLSETFAGKAGLSEAKADTVAKRLALPANERDLFKAMVAAQHAKSPRVREQATAKVRQIRKQTGLTRVSVEAFQVIRDWYHLAILELTKTYFSPMKM